MAGLRFFRRWRLTAGNETATAPDVIHHRGHQPGSDHENDHQAQGAGTTQLLNIDWPMASATPVWHSGAADDKDSANGASRPGWKSRKTPLRAVTRAVKTRATKTSMATTPTRSFLA